MVSVSHQEGAGGAFLYILFLSRSADCACVAASVSTRTGPSPPSIFSVVEPRIIIIIAPKLSKHGAAPQWLDQTANRLVCRHYDRTNACSAMQISKQIAESVCKATTFKTIF